MRKNIILKLFLGLLSSLFVLFFIFPEFFSSKDFYVRSGEIANLPQKILKPVLPPLDTLAYDKKMLELANNTIPQNPIAPVEENNASNQTEPITPPALKAGPSALPALLWPVKTVYPNAGAILPFKRIVAYYGNLYSKQMGVLGEYDGEEMLAKLDREVKRWEEADPHTPVIPALHYVAVVAQERSGKDGQYRLRMPDSEIEKVLRMAEKIPARPRDNFGAGGPALVFLDIQVGFSNLQTEVPLLEKYFKLPNVHLGIDPEFSMKSGIRPGKIVGTFDAGDINFAANYLAQIVRENNLPPKILVVHRYTQKMVTNYQEIKPLPEVELVMNMDGWGDEAKKINTYQQFIYKEPVQFTGFKLFYKNDTLVPGSVLMSPNDLLKLQPQPIYIQYQ